MLTPVDALCVVMALCSRRRIGQPHSSAHRVSLICLLNGSWELSPTIECHSGKPAKRFRASRAHHGLQSLSRAVPAQNAFRRPCDAVCHDADYRSVTAVQDEVIPPVAVRGSDLVGAVWPPGSTLRRPRLEAAVQMAPAGAALNFRLAPGGAAQWWEPLPEILPRPAAFHAFGAA